MHVFGDALCIAALAGAVYFFFGGAGFVITLLLCLICLAWFYS